MVANTSTVVSHTRIGQQPFTFSREGKGFGRASGNSRRGPEAQAIASRGTATSGPVVATAFPKPGEGDGTRKDECNNKVMLTGHVGRNVAIRQTKNGHLVASFVIGVKEAYKDRAGTWQEKITWHRVTAWGMLAETLNSHSQEDVFMYVEGRLQNRVWIDREDRKRYTTEVVARELHVLDAVPKREPSAGIEVGADYTQVQ